MLDRLRQWWIRVTCKHTYLVARMKWVEEYVLYYEECPLCGKEFYADD